MTKRNRACLIILLTMLYACGKVPTAEPEKPIVHFTGDFESGNLMGFYFLVPDTAVNTIIVTHPVRKGNYALQNTLRPGDYTSNGYRAELAVYNSANYHSEGFYGFSMMIDTNYTDTAFNVVCQWQDLPYYIQGEDWQPTPVLHGSSPPVHVTYVNGTLELKMNDNPNSDQDNFRVGNAIPISKGIWYDLVFHIYWSDDDKGFIEMWVNGNQVTPFNGSDCRYYHRNLFTRAGNYFKFGQYRGHNNPAHTNIIYFDELKIGSSYNEVAP